MRRSVVLGLLALPGLRFAVPLRARLLFGRPLAVPLARLPRLVAGCGLFRLFAVACVVRVFAVVFVGVVEAYLGLVVVPRRLFELQGLLRLFRSLTAFAKSHFSCSFFARDDVVLLGRQPTRGFSLGR
jgi:hypothetical protein